MNEYHMGIDYSREQDERAGDRERKVQYDENEESTFERALREITEARERAADEAQADYEREDKLGMI